MKEREKDRTFQVVLRRLIKLLRRLNFADVHVATDDSFPDPFEIKASKNDFIIPWVTARKNGYYYIFDILTNEILEQDDYTRELKLLLEYSHVHPEIEIILVVPYGKKKFYSNILSLQGFSPDHIWESSV